MFSIEKFYRAAHGAKSVDIEGLRSYIQGFEKVILWGAGYLGDAIGKKMIELQLPLTCYWDLRASDIGSIHGKQVVEPFSGEHNKDTTLVMFCITNSFISAKLLSKLKEDGYHHVLIGEYFYQGVICPITEYDGFKACRNSHACDAFSCIRNENIFKQHLHQGNEDVSDDLIFRNVTFVINQKCTLRCKYCYSYTNSYPNKQRINFALPQILEDIDRFFDTIDGVKFIPLIGGETFLHPDVSTIVKKFLEKSNFGILNVTTNGVCAIKPEQLDGLQSDRVQVVFSNYKDALSARQIEIFDKNVELVKASGAHVIVLNSTPQWVVPTTLNNKNYSMAEMTSKKLACINPYSCRYVKNGMFFPCSIADSLYGIGIANYPDDYIRLSDFPRKELRQRIRSLLEQDYYRSCGHCDGMNGHMGLTAKAGEQGFQEFVNL